MKKATIFLIAFMASFMTIYSIYYYKQIKKLDKSVVAMASDLPHTIIGTAGADKSGFNTIITNGLQQALDSAKEDTALAKIPAGHYAPFNAVYTRENMEKYYENLVSKFPNHPPVEFRDVKEGDPVLLSYFFYNIRLPEGYRVSASPVIFHGTKVKALQYHPSATDTGYVSYYKNDSSGQSAFRVKINEGTEELIIYNSKKDNSWQNALKEAREFAADSSKLYHPKKNESVLMPDLDFNITKDIAHNDKDLKKYTLVQERIKFKISAPMRGGPLEVSDSYNTPVNFSMDSNILIYIHQVNNKKPYCIIQLKNTEILKPVRVL